jgi:alpha-galactosidase
MWAILNSPLLMGNDLRIVSPSALSILNNPAVIAINQDPLGKPAIRIKRNQNVAKDQYGMGESQIWSGKLFGGDQVVAFLNAADEDLEMSASLEEIFLRETGKAPQVQEEWDVYDLWANRMSDAVAQKIISSPETSTEVLKKEDWYNSTALSYEDGVKAGDLRLLGKKVETLAPRTSLSRKVRRHSVELFRLRSPNKEGRKKNMATDDNHNEL